MMGQELKQKRNEQFVRCREMQFEKRLRSPDLFSEILPATSQGLVGYIRLPDLAEGDFLWHPTIGQSLEDDSEILLLRGDQDAVLLDGDAAAAIREEEERCGSPLTLRVLEITKEVNLATVGLLAPNKDIN